MKTGEIRLSRKQKKEIKLIVDRYLRIRFKKNLKRFIGIRLK